MLRYLAQPEILRRSELAPIQDPREWYPDLGFSGIDTIDVPDGTLLMCDPTYLCDAYNSTDDPVAAYVRANGVIIMQTDGDGRWPIWLLGSKLIVPIAVPDEMKPRRSRVSSFEIAVDSASFVCLSIDDSTPEAVRQAMLKGHVDRACLTVKPGTYTFQIARRRGSFRGTTDFDFFLLATRNP
ncbi:MAG: hypothetical protein AAF432_01770 [Planctomycetota bacterium]